MSQSNSLSFCVVEFLERNEVSAVSSVWITENNEECWWPPYVGPCKLGRAIKGHEIPGSSWTKYGCRVLKRGISEYTANPICFQF
jgi:hypothetical protein